MLTWQERQQGLLPPSSRRTLALLRGLEPGPRRWLATRYLRYRPLAPALERELVEEIDRCWESGSLPVSRAALVDEVRLLALLEAVQARAAQCAGPVATGRYLKLSSLAPIEELLDCDGRVMLLTPSFGPWQVIAPALARRGYRVGLLDLRPPHRRPPQSHAPGPGLDLLRLPVRGYARPLVQFCRGPRTVVVAVGDEGCGLRWAHAPFLGRSAAIGATPFELARLAEMRILPVFALSEPLGNRLLIERPLRPALAAGGDRLAGLDGVAARWLKIVEKLVRRYPAHYTAQLFQRRRQRHQDPMPLFGDVDS
ncbi:MAG: hypothetical protein CMP23_10435 [Rickettsiales bacterium]|nr:hypothetical protein [Rickettsiales bacterium]